MHMYLAVLEHPVFLCDLVIFFRSPRVLKRDNSIYTINSTDFNEVEDTKL